MGRGAVVIVVTLLLSACGGGAVSEPQDFRSRAATVRASKATKPTVSSNQESSQDSSTVEDMTALEQMEIAFEGNPSQSQIKSKLDRAMDLYGLTKNESNYSRAGSVLVALSNRQGVSEMDILDLMICSHVEGVNMDFPGAAALAVTFLVAGDSC